MIRLKLLSVLLSGLFILVLIPGVIAETGSITLSDDKTFNYTDGNTGVGGYSPANFSKIYWDSTNYNIVHSFNINGCKGGTSFTYANDFESSSFTIVSGGSGGGIGWYDKNLSKVYISFSSGNTYTSSPLILQYTKNIWANVSSSCTLTNVYPSATQPILLGTDGAYPITQWGSAYKYNDVQVSLTATDSYTVSYPAAGIFSVTIDKNPSVSSKYFIDSYTGSYHYSQETTYNKNDISGATYIYAAGISLNMTLSSGLWSRAYVNSSGSGSGGGAPAEGYDIRFNKSFYNLNDGVKVYVNTSNFDPLGSYVLMFYQLETTAGSSPIHNNYVVNSSNKSIIPIIDKTLNSYLYAYLYKNGVVVKASDTINYGFANFSNVTGNLSLDKSSYSRNETVTITYNSSTSGRIIIYSDELLFNENIEAGNNQKKYFYISKLELFPVYVKLQYFYDDAWSTLDYRVFETVEDIDAVNFLQSYAANGEVIDIQYSSTGNGFLILNDSNGNILMNSSITDTSGESLLRNYYISYRDPGGLWTISLVNATGITLDSDTITIYTASPTTAAPSDIDYIGNLTAKKAKENELLNTFYGSANGLLALAILATMMFLLRKMRV